MKNFTFLLILLIIAVTSNGQTPQNLQNRITKMQETYSRLNRQTEHFYKARFPLASESYKSSLLKNALAVQKLDSVIYQEYLAAEEEWINYWKDEYLYDSEMKNTAYIESEWNVTTNSWEATDKVEIELNSEGKVSIMRTYSTLDTAGEFVLDTRSEAYYSAEGLLDSVFHFSADTTGTWEKEGSQIYHYNESGQLVQMDFTSLEEDEEGEYIQTMRFVYTYNDAGQMATSSMFFIDAEMEFLFSETEFIYDDSGRLIASEDSVLNFFTFAVELSSRTDYEYNSNGDVSVETYSYREPETEEWVVEQKFEYTYNDTSFSEVVFPSYIQFWGVNEETNSFNYAVSEILTSSFVDGEWIVTERSQFYYSEGGVTNTRDLTETGFRVFPNPASDKVTVTWNGYGFLSLEVYTITGAKVIEKQVTSGMDIQVSTLNNGIYLMKILKENQAIYSGKLIKK